VILLLDETIITETPPLSCGYGRIGEQLCVSISGNHATRVVHGVINLHTRSLLLLSTEHWDHYTPQYFLTMIRSQWRGWNIELFADRGSPHTAADRLALAATVPIDIRLLPTATPALSAMDQ
jgi:hypothetical protein